MSSRISRRKFIQTAGLGATALAAGCATGKSTQTAMPAAPKTPSANGKLNMAAIGAGGKGSSDIGGCESENIVALCDVDWDRAAETFARYPNAKRYKDYRQMLEEMGDQIDAVTVSTPDHMHAPAASLAMSMGIHVYVQKPLTHTVLEARALTELARKYDVKTQMGNQGHSGQGVRMMAEMIWNGDLGQVREAHIWTNRPVWPQGFDRPKGVDPIPNTLDWDLWLGAAPYRPYVAKNPVDPGSACYLPFVWRGWWDFGCGALGDMACHIMDSAFYSLQLGYPDSFELVMQEGRTKETGPTASTIKYEFPARTAALPNGKTMPMDPVTVYWYDGHLSTGEQNLPPRPDGVAPDELLGKGDNGSILIGTKATATANEYGENPRIVTTDLKDDYERPERWLPRVKRGHYNDWLEAIKGEQEQACSNFDYAGPFTETVLLGNFCVRIGEPGQVFEWDGANTRVSNIPEANQFLTKEYRKGFELAT